MFNPTLVLKKKRSEIQMASYSQFMMTDEVFIRLVTDDSLC